MSGNDLIRRHQVLASGQQGLPGAMAQNQYLILSADAEQRGDAQCNRLPATLRVDSGGSSIRSLLSNWDCLELRAYTFQQLSGAGSLGCFEGLLQLQYGNVRRTCAVQTISRSDG